MKGPKKYPCGKMFWKDIKTTFRAMESPQKSLAGRKEDVMQPFLLDAMAVYKNTGKRAKLFAFMRVGTILNQAEAVGIM